MIRLDRTFIQNPHDLYRRLRAKGPAARLVIWGAVPVWLITRYTEARALLNDPRLSEDHARMNIATVRFTIVPIRVGDVDIPANELVMIALSAANRDDGQFDNPDRPDITRKPHSHLAFGHGIHYCVGAPLARLEAEVALDRLLARFVRITVDDAAALQYRISTPTRALKSLPVQLIPR